ncbi:MAG: hypothetical protein KBD78_11810 [Oligoflexales bacterium]|nr:hypothetical protein [Oligoflexales bacterium]
MKLVVKMLFRIYLVAIQFGLCQIAFAGGSGVGGGGWLKTQDAILQALKTQTASEGVYVLPDSVFIDFMGSVGSNPDKVNVDLGIVPINFKFNGGNVFIEALDSSQETNYLFVSESQIQSAGNMEKLLKMLNQSGELPILP